MLPPFGMNWDVMLFNIYNILYHGICAFMKAYKQYNYKQFIVESVPFYAGCLFFTFHLNKFKKNEEDYNFTPVFGY